MKCHSLTVVCPKTAALTITMRNLSESCSGVLQRSNNYSISIQFYFYNRDPLIANSMLSEPPKSSFKLVSLIQAAVMLKLDHSITLLPTAIRNKAKRSLFQS